MADRSAMPWITGALVVAALVIAWPYAPWLLVAIWGAILLGPLHRRIGDRLGHRPRLAAFLVVVAMIVLVVPIGILLGSLAKDAVALVRHTLESERVQSLLQPLDNEDQNYVGLAVSHGGRAWAVVQQIAGTAARAVIGLVIGIGGLYVMLVDGAPWYGWFERNSPLSRDATRRLAGVFVETGRGLVFGILGAGLAQAIVATVAYVALDVPHAFALGVLTLFCSVIPAIGTAIVWVPVTAALALDDRQVAAAVMGIIGVGAIGTIDNLVRPYLARRGSLQLPTYVVAVAMFGGVTLLGARGVVIGPLVVRLAKEALAITRSERDRSTPSS